MTFGFEHQPNVGLETIIITAEHYLGFNVDLGSYIRVLELQGNRNGRQGCLLLNSIITYNHMRKWAGVTIIDSQHSC